MGTGRGTLTLRGYLEESRRFRCVLLASVPLFAVYEAGLILLTGGQVKNAADVWVKHWLRLDGRQGTLILNTLVMAGFLGALLWRKGPVRREVLGLLVVESAFWGMLLAPVTLGIRSLVTLRAGLPGGGRLEDAVLGIGAGLYEEILFRLVLIGGGSWALIRLAHVDPIWAKVSTLVLSSLAFSSFHHVGSMGEPWDTGVFVYRFLAGLLLGALFLGRGFGVAAWSHALYDVFLALR